MNRLALAGAALLVAGWTVAEGQGQSPEPLPQAHAHNDYEHPRPLLDALDHGFCGVEADVFLVDGELLVAHDREDLRPERTLRALYLDPLRERVAANGGRVYRGSDAVLTLLVDIKSEAGTTFTALDEVLADYAEILTRSHGGEVTPGAVTVVVSGNREVDAIAGAEPRYAGIDGRLADLDSEAGSDVLPLVSDRWGSHFRWTGDGEMPGDERVKLRAAVAKAHAAGRRVRFWATPESPTVWRELLAAGVDLINTDDLVGLREFLLAAREADRPR